MSIELKFRELLVPVLGFDEVEEVELEGALVNDLGADSLDFVEIVYVIEKNFGVVLKTNEIIVGGESVNQDMVFEDGCLTDLGLEIIDKKFPENKGRFKSGMTKVEIFSQITVKDLVNIIELKMAEDK